MNLSEGVAGDGFIVLELQTDLKIKKRLQDMGFTKGVQIKIMSFYANNAFIISIRGTRVVIGKDIASEILVEPSPCNQSEKKHHPHERKRSGGFHFGKQHRGASICIFE